MRPWCHNAAVHQDHSCELSQGHPLSFYHFIWCPFFHCLPTAAVAIHFILTPALMVRCGEKGAGGEQDNEERGGDGFVILVIKDRVVSVSGVRTGCGKLPESLWGKAAPFLFCPVSGELIISSNSQDGILYLPFPHLFFTFLFLCSFSFTSLCHPKHHLWLCSIEVIKL